MLSPQTTSDLIAAELRREISSGTVPPGAPLRQETLARRFRVSRIPVREALRALERDGLVEVHPNRGAFVVRLSADQIREITDLRVLLEGDLIHRAVPKMTPRDVANIERAAHAADLASTTPEWSVADWAFHEAAYQPAERPHQLALVSSLRRAVERYWAIYGQLPQRRGAWLKDHAELLEACRRGDAAAARRILAAHITGAGKFLVGKLESARVADATPPRSP